MTTSFNPAKPDSEKHHFRISGAHAKAITCKDPEVLLVGPAGTGKTRTNLEKLHLACMRYPGIRCAMIRKTATSLTSSVVVEFAESVANDAIASGEVKFDFPNAIKPAQYRYRNGSVIVLGGMDNANKVLSTQYDLVYVCEAIELSQNDWEFIAARLRNNKMPYQQIIADTNPTYPHHWLKQRCDAGITTMFNTSHKDNPVYWDGSDWTAEGSAYLDRLKTSLTGVRKARLLDGHWVAAEGLVYDEIDEDVHVIDRYRDSFPPVEWPRYWAIDFGYKVPFVCQFWAVDPDGRLILYREIYRSHTLVEDHAEAIQRARHVKKGIDPMPRAIIADSADPEAIESLSRKLEFPVKPANKNVMEGIQAVKERLKVQPDGKPRILFCRDAVWSKDSELVESRLPVCTTEELSEYVWDTRKEAPVKANDHGMDAMRYLVMYLDRGARPRFHVVTF